MDGRTLPLPTAQLDLHVTTCSRGDQDGARGRTPAGSIPAAGLPKGGGSANGGECRSSHHGCNEEGSSIGVQPKKDTRRRRGQQCRRKRFRRKRFRRRSGGRGGGESRVGSGAEDRFSSSASFGSVTQTKPVGTGTSTWKGSFVKGSRCCCSCVPLSRRGSSADARVSSGQAGAPETFDGESDGWVKPQEPTEKGKGKGGFRPRHRRGHSTGHIAHGTNPSARAARITQPQGWEAGGGGSSATTSTTSSTGSTALAVAAASGGGEGGRETVLSWGRRSGSWGAGGVAAADREFNRILKSGVDVFKHCSTRESTQQWVDVVPKRIKEFLSRSCPLEDENEGLVTLFLDKERENLCWCPPGAAELVPDERYSLSVRSLVEVVPGDSVHPRVLSLRSAGRANPLVFELDSDDLYDILSQGIVRILERNHLRDTLMVDPRNFAAI
ncbi:hypothetical protein Esi_0181_0027 [Ectocarpus siliculosus]|uniref:Uncharacterized protein n=1 Tax=Ectocarpus siliculosus TaxID=2880 RepID=D8LGU4_ECTSI|nr:hypothetical protein Esi_0181_0027 [Ectocarpus siliculosus]|eukprot:CBN75797.1 hypothetical protein Esi_0181_0027 [Ectocarpus siliculosus]